MSELTYWRWKAGDPVDVTLASAAPFAWQIAGDWERAATAWEARGCPYEAARARADSDDARRMHDPCPGRAQAAG